MSDATAPPPSSSTPPSGAWIEATLVILLVSAAVSALCVRLAPVIAEVARVAISTGGPIRASVF